MTGIILTVYVLGILTGVLGLVSCRERREMKRQLGYPTRETREIAETRKERHPDA